MQEEGMKSALQVRIEQAIAFGRSVDWILRHLPATVADINTAMRTLDAAVKDDPYVQRQITRRRGEHEKCRRASRHRRCTECTRRDREAADDD